MPFSSNDNLIVSIIDSLEFPVVVYGENYDMLYYNKNYLQQFGIPPKGLMDNLAQKHDSRILEIYSSLKSKKKRSVTFYKTLVTSDNKMIRVKVNTRLVEHQGKLYFFEVFRDSVDVSFLKNDMLADRLDPFSIGLIRGGGHFVSRSGVISGIPTNENFVKESSPTSADGDSRQWDDFFNHESNSDDNLDSFVDLTTEDRFSDILNMLSMRSKSVKFFYHLFRPSLNHITGLAELLSVKLKNDPVGLDYLNRIIGSSTKILDHFNYIHEITRIEAGEIELRQDTIDIREYFGTLKDKIDDEHCYTQLNVQHCINGNLIMDRLFFDRIILLLCHNMPQTDDGYNISLTCNKLGEVGELFIRYYVTDGTHEMVCDLKRKTEFVYLKLLASMLQIDFIIYEQSRKVVVELKIRQRFGS